MHRILIATAALAVALTPGRAAAGYEFRFASGTTEQTNFNINPSPGFVDINVYLVATGAEASTLQANGLRSFGVQLNYSGTATAKVISATDITNNAAFTGPDGRSIENNGGALDWARSRDSILTGAVASSANGADQRILLATFRFTGLSNGDTLVFSADPIGTNDNVLGDGTLIDTLIIGQSATIAVAIPEPGTMALTGLLATGIAGGMWRRVRRQAAADAAV
jgi:hypothetical protein